MRSFFAFALAFATLFAPARAQTVPPMRGDVVGINTGISPNYYGNSYALADVTKTMTPWTQSPWGAPAFESTFDKSGGLIIDTTQQPAQAWVRCYDTADDFPLGDYIATWKGDGDFYQELGAPSWVGPQFGGVDGRAVVPIRIRHSEGVGLKIVCTRSNPANRVRDFHLWQPGCVPGQKSSFRPEFLRSLRGFTMVRTIKDNGAEASRIEKYEDRAKPSDPRWTGDNGLPYEVQIELANSLGTDLYLNIPYKASDDFNRKLARLVKRKLSTKRVVFLEWYNELWNWGYWGSQDSVNRYAPGTDQATGNYFGVATTYGPYRARQVHAIWEAEFSGPDRARLKTVLGGMFGWPEVTDQIVTWAKGMSGDKPPSDAIAVAPYFNASSAFLGPDGKILPELAGKTDAELLDLLFADLAGVIRGSYRNGCLAARRSADRVGAMLVAYESGQHLVARGDDAQGQRIFLLANRDGRMGDLYKLMLDTMTESGFERINIFQDVCKPTIWGYFGLRESGEMPLAASPKNRGRVEWQFDASAPIQPDVLRLPPPAGPPKIPDTVPTPSAVGVPDPEPAAIAPGEKVPTALKPAA